MPLVINDKWPEAHLLIWKLEEDTNYYLSRVKLCEEELEKFHKIKVEGRKKEFLCARMLLQMFLGASVELSYHQDGRPFLKNNVCHISISHSKTHLGILLSHVGAPGLDIELVSSRPSRIYDKFVGKEEKQFVRKEDQKATTLLWSAKEAIFKMICRQGIDFKTAIKLNPFSIADKGALNGFYLVSEAWVELNYQFIDGNVIVWGIAR